MTVEEQLTVLANDIQKTREAVIRMEGKLDNVVDKVKDQGDVLDDHEKRIREIEKSRWPLPQIGMILSFIAVALSFIAIFII